MKKVIGFAADLSEPLCMLTRDADGIRWEVERLRRLIVIAPSAGTPTQTFPSQIVTVAATVLRFGLVFRSRVNREGPIDYVALL